MRLPPKPDESASSWLFRCARAHGESPHGFARWIWGHGVVWTRDADRSLSSDALLQLALRMDVPPQIALGTSLMEYEGRCVGKRVTRGVAPGILALGVYHRTRRRHGQQFCPTCIAEDEEPYYRKQWRLAFVFLCMRHQSFLVDACPICDGPISAYRPAHIQLGLCGSCGAELKRANVLPAFRPHVAAQQRLLSSWSSDSMTIGGERVTFSSWLTGLRLIFTLQQRGSRRQGSWEAGGGQFREGVRLQPLECSRVHLRATGLLVGVAITQTWPLSLIAVADRFGLRKFDFLEVGRQVAPDWYVAALSNVAGAHSPRKSVERKRRTKSSGARISRRKALGLLGASAAIEQKLRQIERLLER